MEPQPPSGPTPGMGTKLKGGYSTKSEVRSLPLRMLEVPTSSHKAFLQSHTGVTERFPENKSALLTAEQSDAQVRPAHLHVSLSMTLLVCWEIKGSQFARESL